MIIVVALKYGTHYNDSEMKPQKVLFHSSFWNSINTPQNNFGILHHHFRTNAEEAESVELGHLKQLVPSQLNSLLQRMNKTLINKRSTDEPRPN